MNKTCYTDAKKNAFRISSYSVLEEDLPMNGIAIKWVLTGKENYQTWNHSYSLRPNEFLLLNDLRPCHVSIRSKEPSAGICIDLSPKLIREVLDADIPEEKELFDFVFSDRFPVLAHNIQGSALGKKLSLFQEQGRHPMYSDHFFMQEYFYVLARAFVKDQENVLTNYKGLSLKNKHSSNSVLRALLMAREYIFDNLCTEISLDELSKLACMSKYNFIRRFTEAFGDSPYRFIIHQRLMKAAEHLEKGLGIEETARMFMFYDVPAFYRAFKKRYHITPAQFKKGNILQA